MSTVHAALRTRFAAPEWALMFEVRNATGFNGVTRSADALAMNLWPSRGLELHGVEVKVSRSDWLRELKDPAKSDAIQRYCDRWWLAVADATIVQDGELPPTWGLLVLRKDGKLVQKVEAPKLEAVPMTRGFIGSVLRNITETSVPKQVFEAEVEERAKARSVQSRGLAERRADSAEASLKELAERVAAFEEASGVTLGQWTPGRKIGEAVKHVLQNEGAIINGLTRTREQLANLVSMIDRVKKDVA